MHPTPGPRATTSADVQRLIGLTAFLKLSDTYGGTDIKIPNCDSGAQFRELVAIIGIENTSKLIAVYGGDRLYVSNGMKPRLTLRNEAIRTEFDSKTKTLSATEAIRQLSLSYHLSNRKINDILKRLD